MSSLETALHLKHAAETALAEGNHMQAMDLFGEAAELLYDEGYKELSDECAFKLRDVIALMAAEDDVELPINLLTK